MVKEIVKDQEVLTKKSEKLNKDEPRDFITDMLETADLHKDRCVGLAAIQIGIPKRVILVKMGQNFKVFVNPNIIWKGSESYIANESCLSLEGEREVKRHKQIRVAYETASGKIKVENFKGFIAQIFQHEVDHLNGVLI